MYNLGIDIQTGTLQKLLDNGSPSRILSTSNGEMVIEVPKQGMALGGTYSQKYEATDSLLIFISKGRAEKSVYKKSKIGDKITAPIVSKFFTTMDSDTFTNARIWNYPSAYLGYGYCAPDSLVFEINAQSAHNSAIRIQLNNFTGTGTYTLGTGNDGMGFYDQFGGCLEHD